MTALDRGSRDRSLRSPRYWGVWLGIGAMRLFVRLPLSMQRALGRTLGALAWRVARRERRIGEINLRLCFPELSGSERTRLLRQHFRSLGCALFDTALAWWGKRERVLKLTHVEGWERLERVLREGRGALLVCGHFTAAEMGVRALTTRYPVAVMYQELRNPVLAEQFRDCLGAIGAQMIRSDNVRGLLRALKDNLPVWLAADQREDMRSCTLAPFFGIPVASNTAPARIARIANAAVLPYSIERNEPGGGRRAGYHARIGEPLEGFPTDDEVEDALRLNALLEADVLRCPAQYLWTYKRFKHPGADPYKK